jgi:hypothetical protein
MKSYIINSIYYIVSFVILLFVFKPSIVFKPDGTSREFGLGIDNQGYKKTLYNTHFILLLAIFSTYFYMRR